MCVWFVGFDRLLLLLRMICDEFEVGGMFLLGVVKVVGVSGMNKVVIIVVSDVVMVVWCIGFFRDCRD